MGEFLQVREAATSLTDPESEHLLRELDAALVQTAVGEREDLDALFRLFERHPESDGLGVFWVALHWIEGQAGQLYERALIESLLRKPVHLTIHMVNRMLNAKVETAEGSDPRQILRRIAADSTVHDATREEALKMLARHSFSSGQSA